MLEYDRIDISEGIYINKKEDTSRECSLCKFYYFLNKNFNYQTNLCDGCHDISMKAISMQSMAIIYDGKKVYRVNFMFMNRREAYNVIKNAVIIDKKGTLRNLIQIKHLLK